MQMHRQAGLKRQEREIDSWETRLDDTRCRSTCICQVSDPLFTYQFGCPTLGASLLLRLGWEARNESVRDLAQRDLHRSAVIVGLPRLARQFEFQRIGILSPLDLCL